MSDLLCGLEPKAKTILQKVSTNANANSQHPNTATATATATTAAENTPASDQDSPADDTSESSEPASAATQVLATTELLEHILLSLDDVKSLVSNRRVARRWRDIIDDTSSLKKEMWLVPQQLDHEWYLSPGASHLRKRPKTTTATAAPADSSDTIYASGTFNPHLLHIAPSDTHRPLWRSEFHYNWISQPLHIHKRAIFSIGKPQSLFRKMFVTQPPVKLMYLRVRNGDDERRNYRCLVEKVKNSTGVRVGDVLRALSRMPKSQEMMLVVEEMIFPTEEEVEISDTPWEGFPYRE